MPYRILYIEDHDDTRVIVTILLERAGFQVTWAGCGRTGLELARAGRFDLYLLDHTFPDASGLTVCRSIREFDPSTPILFYSARAMEDEKRAALEAGAQEYLVKPLDIFNVAEHATRLIDGRTSA